MKKLKYIFVTLMVILSSCDETDEILAAVAPTNLAVSNTVSNDGSGTVTFSATATGANWYCN